MTRESSFTLFGMGNRFSRGAAKGKERRCKQPQDALGACVAHFAQTERQFSQFALALAAIGTEQAVPDRERRAIIAVRFCLVRAMMDPVHIRRDQDETERPVEPARQANVGVGDDHHGRVQHLVQQYRQRWDTERDHAGDGEWRRCKRFERVKARRRADVHLRIEVMHAVYAP